MRAQKQHSRKLIPRIGPVLAFCVVAVVSATAQNSSYQPIYNFNQADGDVPNGQLIVDSRGDLYGVTRTDENIGFGCGAVYRLSNSAGTWKTTALYEFTGADSACNPWAGLVMDSKGNVYGSHWPGGDGGQRDPDFRRPAAEPAQKSGPECL